MVSLSACCGGCLSCGALALWHYPPLPAKASEHRLGRRRLTTIPVLLQTESGETPILTQSIAKSMKEALPLVLGLAGEVEWCLKYTPKTHGISMETLLRNVRRSKNTLIIVEDADGRIFGGFASEPWVPQGHRRFYGSGESFLFSYAREEDGPPEIQLYPWTAKNNFIQYVDHDIIAMGCGDGQHAFALHEDLLRGHSSPTPTFGNPALAASEEFVVKDIEIWSLEMVA
jgi:hypothetical protein